MSTLADLLNSAQTKKNVGASRGERKQAFDLQHSLTNSGQSRFKFSNEKTREIDFENFGIVQSDFGGKIVLIVLKKDHPKVKITSNVFTSNVLESSLKEVGMFDTPSDEEVIEKNKPFNQNYKLVKMEIELDESTKAVYEIEKIKIVEGDDSKDDSSEESKNDSPETPKSESEGESEGNDPMGDFFN